MPELPEWIDLPRRKAMRHPSHDYTTAGAYPIVTCTDKRIPLLGKLVGEEMQLNGIGRMAEAALLAVPSRHAGVDVLGYRIMPDHIHVCFLLADIGMTGRSIGLIKLVQGLKAHVGRAYSVWRNEHAPQLPPKLLQDGFWDRIIRTEEELYRTLVYMDNNPLQAKLDREAKSGTPR